MISNSEGAAYLKSNDAYVEKRLQTKDKSFSFVLGLTFEFDFFFLSCNRSLPVEFDPLFLGALKIRKNMFPFDRQMYMGCHPL